LDTNAAEALKLLLEDGPTEPTDDLADWTTEDLNGKPMLFYQGRQYIPKDDNLRRQIQNSFITQSQLDTPENWRHTSTWPDSIGGQA